MCVKEESFMKFLRKNAPILLLFALLVNAGVIIHFRYVMILAIIDAALALILLFPIADDLIRSVGQDSEE